MTAPAGHAEQPAHQYLSTACFHGLHDGPEAGDHPEQRCRRTCKFCSEPCICYCHTRAYAGPVYLLGWADPARVRAVLRANMFDGEEGGLITQDASGLLDDMVEVLCGPAD